MRLKGLAGSSTDDLVKCVVLLRKHGVKSADENRARIVLPVRCTRKKSGRNHQDFSLTFFAPCFRQTFYAVFPLVIQHADHVRVGTCRSY